MLRFGWRLWDVGCVGQDEQDNPYRVTWELLHGRYFSHSATRTELDVTLQVCDLALKRSARRLSLRGDAVQPCHRIL